MKEYFKILFGGQNSQNEGGFKKFCSKKYITNSILKDYKLVWLSSGLQTQSVFRILRGLKSQLGGKLWECRKSCKRVLQHSQ